MDKRTGETMWNPHYLEKDSTTQQETPLNEFGNDNFATASKNQGFLFNNPWQNNELVTNQINDFKNSSQQQFLNNNNNNNTNNATNSANNITNSNTISSVANNSNGANFNNVINNNNNLNNNAKLKLNGSFSGNMSFSNNSTMENNKNTNNITNMNNMSVNVNDYIVPNDEDFERYKRRKSSLVIPPTRAAGPNPFQYDNYPYYTMSTGNNNYSTARNNSISINPSLVNNNNLNVNSAVNSKTNNASLQRQALFAKQQQQQQGLNSMFIPSLFDSQDFQRRQSLATNLFSNNHKGNGSNSQLNNLNFNNNNNPSSSATTANNNNSNNSNGNTNNGNTNINGNNLFKSSYNLNFNGVSMPRASPYRRLSAYPTSNGTFSPQFTPLNETQIIIPQLQNVFNRSDLKPIVNANPKFRRASVHSTTISPLKSLTKNLITTYQLCSPDFIYQTSKNPKRVLTKPSEGKFNNGFDNINSDYILYVNDVLGIEQNRKYLVLDMLGQGTFGQVVKCQNLETKEILAVKVIKSRSEYLNQSITEAKILELINTKIDPHDKHHFLRLYDSFVHKNHLCLAFELLSNNLYELLKQNQYHGLSMPLIKNFAKQMLDSLCVLKDSKLIHCDLKPENILLCSPDRPEIKIIDFGSACEETRTVYTYIQSRFYRAPEIILGIPYSTGIDMWSLGCIIAELFLGIPIFPGSSEYNQITRIVETLYYPPNWMLEMGKNTQKFMKKLDNFELANLNDPNNPNNHGHNNDKYRLKTIEEFRNDFKNVDEKPGKKYFKFTKLHEIIRNYRIPKNIQHSNELIEQEMNHRDCLIHFLTGLLNINPLERWTPQQANLHPFITNQPFNGEWYPPGTLQTISKKTIQSNSNNNNSKNSITNSNSTNTTINSNSTDDTDNTNATDNNNNINDSFEHISPQGTTKDFNNLNIAED